MEITMVSVLIAALGCAVGVAGWLRNRDKDSAGNAEWRGQISAKLDSILSTVTGQGRDIERMDERINKFGERLAAVEASAKQAHRRLDEQRKGGANHDGAMV